ncbi:sigma-E factor negative regulatory protein [Pigmentiphaga humi]|uniref:sigma-E factor negative regulatory protein n=1 Tax=Pigmentiphaga humi TaxID=2478468 RepID=UPI003CCC8E58
MTSHRNESAVSGVPEGQDGLAQAEAGEWLSAYLDGELDEPPPRFSAYLASADGKAHWDLYHLVGDVLRTPELAAPVSADFHQRLLRALEQEAPIVAAPRRASTRRFMVRYGFPGLAAAAAVASVTWIAQPYFGTPGGSFELASAQPEQPAVVQVAAPAPRARKAEPQVDVALGEYLDAHRQVAGRSAIRQVSVSSLEASAGQR